MMSILSLMFVLVCYGNQFIIPCHTTKTCSRIERGLFDGNIRFYVKYFCCGNFEPTGNHCKECEAGFTSVKGDNCSKCKYGSYGKRCAEMCHCGKDQRCNNVLGCVAIFRNMSIDGNRLWTTDNILKDTETTADIILEDGSKESKQTVTIGLTSIICGILFVGCLVCVCWKYQNNKKRNTILVLTGTRALQRQIANESQIANDQFEQIEIHEYEEIDDNIISRDLSIISGEESISDGSSNESSVKCGTDSDGYLHPYHSIISADPEN